LSPDRIAHESAPPASVTPVLGTELYRALTSKPNGRPRLARKLGTTTVVGKSGSPLARCSSSGCLSLVPVAATPMSKPRVPSGAAGVSGL
jgi:hypothetical protein